MMKAENKCDGANETSDPWDSSEVFKRSNYMRVIKRQTLADEPLSGVPPVQNAICLLQYQEK